MTKIAASGRLGQHSLRRQVVGEMHLRRFPPFTLPAKTIQLLRLVQSQDRDAEYAILDDLPCASTMDRRHRAINWSPQVNMTWERHNEASTITVSIADGDSRNVSWDGPMGGDAAMTAMQWAKSFPGDVIRASKLIVVSSDDEASALVRDAGFNSSHLVSCHLAGGARLWTDFRIHPDGYGRHLVAANEMPLADLIRVVQRLHELSNYRNLALLGLPAAQAAWEELDQIERSLVVTSSSLRTCDRKDDDLLASLIQQAEDLLSLASACDYRLTATRAYSQIVADRLVELKATPIPGFQSLDDFTGRRFHPAIRTCAALSERMALLNSRITQLTALLRTRIETNIEHQNGRLLASMDRSTRLQLRLQHLVEGLSAVAISYYLIGLLAYPLKAVEKWIPSISATTVLGASAPFIIFLVFLLLGRMRRHLVTLDDGAAAEGG